jgi:hypothetical protein
MLNLTGENRIELLAALVGAVVGIVGGCFLIVGGYLSANQWFIMPTWAG